MFTIDEDLVQADLRNNTTAQEHQFLRQPENLQAWADVLKALKRDVELQFSNQRSRIMQQRKAGLDREAWHEFKDKEETWKAKARKFASVIEAHLQEAKRLRSQHTSTVLQAIAAHKSEIEPEDATEADLALWRILDDQLIRN